MSHYEFKKELYSAVVIISIMVIFSFSVFFLTTRFGPNVLWIFLLVLAASYVASIKPKKIFLLIPGALTGLMLGILGALNEGIIIFLLISGVIGLIDHFFWRTRISREDFMNLEFGDQLVCRNDDHWVVMGKYMTLSWVPSFRITRNGEEMILLWQGDDRYGNIYDVRVSPWKKLTGELSYVEKHW